MDFSILVHGRFSGNKYHDRAVEMNRSQVIKILSHGKPLLSKRYGVTRLALFGSTARDTANSDSDSDSDILVAFDGPATSERYFGVQFFLQDQLGQPVDLVPEKALRAELCPFIEKEAVYRLG
jgi:predicted nucleotidyltransferase